MIITLATADTENQEVKDRLMGLVGACLLRGFEREHPAARLIPVE